MRDSRYFNWLVGLVGGPDPYNDLFLETAFELEFKDIIPNDINRVEDGLELREMYGRPVSLNECTVLEMMIALGRRIQENLFEYKSEARAGYWFWVIVDNLNLNKFMGDKLGIQQALVDMVDRKYSRSGDGGLFPLSSSSVDQRKVEIWYQMMAWLDEFDTS